MNKRIELKCRKCGLTSGGQEGLNEGFKWFSKGGVGGVRTFRCSKECNQVLGANAKNLCWIFSTKDALAVLDRDGVEIDPFIVSDEEGRVWRMLHSDDQGRVCASLFTLEWALRILKNIQTNAIKSAKSSSARSKINEVCFRMEEIIKDGMKDDSQELENFDFTTIMCGLSMLNFCNYNLPV